MWPNSPMYCCRRQPPLPAVRWLLSCGGGEREERPFVAVEVDCWAQPPRLCTIDACASVLRSGRAGEEGGRVPAGPRHGRHQNLAKYQTRAHAAVCQPQPPADGSGHTREPAAMWARRGAGRGRVEATTAANQSPSARLVHSLRRGALPPRFGVGGCARRARGGCGPAVRRFKRSGASMRRPWWPGDLVGQVGGARVIPAAARRPPVLVRPPCPRTPPPPRPHTPRPRQSPPRRAPRPALLARRARTLVCHLPPPSRRLARSARPGAPPCTPRGPLLRLARRAGACTRARRAVLLPDDF